MEGATTPTEPGVSRRSPRPPGREPAPAKARVRVAGNSGPMANETTWDAIGAALGVTDDLTEFTTVTRKVRRVGEFDLAPVKAAFQANHPTRLVLNHLDHLGSPEDLDTPGTRVRELVDRIEIGLGQRVAWLGFSPTSVREWRRLAA